MQLLKAIAISGILGIAGTHVPAWADSPAISFTPPKSDLGAQLVGTGGPAALETIQNQTIAPLLVSAIRLEGDDGTDFAVTQVSTFPVLLPPGGNLTLQITFTPRAPWRPGTRDAHLIVTTGQGVYFLELTGMGVTCAGAVWAAHSSGACADTDGDGFNDEWEDRGYIDLNNNGREDDEDLRFPYRASHHFTSVVQRGTGTGQLFPTVSDPEWPVNSSTVLVKVVSGGKLGTATFQYSIGGHAVDGTLTTRPLTDIGENLRLLFYAGQNGATYVAGDTYTFTTSMGERVKVADKNVPNIYVQYDYMGYAAGSAYCANNDACSAGGTQLNSVCHANTCTHSHAPGDPLLRKVVDQFAAHGITLYIEPIHEAVPHAQVITWAQQGDGSSGALTSCAGGNVVKGNIGPGQFAVNFHDIKNRRGPVFARDLAGTAIYHYTVFSHYSTCLTDTPGPVGFCGACPPDRGTPTGISFAGATGTAELPGNDFIVSLGDLLNNPLGSEPNDPFIEQGLFMHELGHNLGLHHAGDSPTPQGEPNYLSVMNYNYATSGIAHAASPGGLTPVERLREINYSEHALRTLVENSLKEAEGVSPLASGYTGLLFFFNAKSISVMGPEAGPVDWNANQAIDATPVTVDLNASGGVNETMRGYADWVHGACTTNADCPINAIRQLIHNGDPSVDPHEPCVRDRCQSLWLPFQFTPWGKKD